MKQYLVTEEFIKATLAILQSMPYNQVYPVVDAIRQLKPFEPSASEKPVPKEEPKK